jgi:hypothetical protein
MSTEKTKTFHWCRLLLFFIIFISKMLEFLVISYFLFRASKNKFKLKDNTKKIKTINLTLINSRANANATNKQKIRNT